SARSGAWAAGTGAARSGSADRKLERDGGADGGCGRESADAPARAAAPAAQHSVPDGTTANSRSRAAGAIAFGAPAAHGVGSGNDWQGRFIGAVGRLEWDECASSPRFSR